MLSSQIYSSTSNYLSTCPISNSYPRKRNNVTLIHLPEYLCIQMSRNRSWNCRFSRKEGRKSILGGLAGNVHRSMLPPRTIWRSRIDCRYIFFVYFPSTSIHKILPSALAMQLFTVVKNLPSIIRVRTGRERKKKRKNELRS